MKKPLFWITIFVSLAGLSTIYLFAVKDSGSRTFMGFPDWLLIFFILEIILVGCIVLFTSSFWKGSNTGS